MLRIIFISAILVFSVISQSSGYLDDQVASAQSDEESSVLSSLLRIEDDTPSTITVDEGDTVTLRGHLESLVLQNMTVSVSLESNATEGRDWVQVNKTPTNSFALPAAESVPYEFNVRFQTHGTFLLQVHATILEIPNRPTPIDASSPDCSGCRITATTVTVPAPASSLTSVVVATAIAIAGVVVLSGWYLKRRSVQKPRKEE